LVLLRHALLICSLGATATLTLGLKVAHYVQVGPDPVTREEAAVAAFLQEYGWVRVGVLDLTVQGYTHAVRYRARTCAREIRVAVLTPNGQDAGLVNDMVSKGERLLFVDHGTISETPPSYAPIQQKLGRLSQTLHLPFSFASPYLAIAAPAECHIETDVPWRSLL
jgi:hypothetical protein